MKRILPVLLILFISGCARVPITHRKQVNLVSEYQLMQSSNVAYEAFLSENSIVSPYDSRSVMVKKVGNNLAIACQKFLADYGDSERMAGYQWEFNLIESSEANAWCMPGGKVVVYTGILDFTMNESGLATVLGHEIAHAIARHGNEQVSQQIIAKVGGSTIQAVLASSSYIPNQLDNLVLDAYSLGSTVGLLNFSRNQESEADKMGLVFMEYAGYDSYAAIGFWKRMAASSSGSVPELLSTHPADEKRIMEIETFIPVAKSYVK